MDSVIITPIKEIKAPYMVLLANLYHIDTLVYSPRQMFAASKIGTTFRPIQ